MDVWRESSEIRRLTACRRSVVVVSFGSATREVGRGAAISEVARRLGVRPGTLSWWRWNLRNEQPKREPDLRRRRIAKPGFLPVVLAQAAPVGRGGLVEVDAGNARVRIEVGVDVHYVAALVRALRSEC